MKKVLITIIAILLPMLVNGGVKKTIHVATAGTLSNYISDEEKYQIEELTLTGEINGMDLGLLRIMAGRTSYYKGALIAGHPHYYCIEEMGGETEGKLAVLDLSGVSIVSGGTYLTFYDDNNERYDYYYANSNEIPSLVFMCCNKLTSVILPNNVTSIGYRAFDSCCNITSVIIPNSLISTGNYAFSGCVNLISVQIGNSVMTIETGTFKGCTGLTNITIPNSVTSIKGDAFSGCTSLSSVTIPNSVTSVGLNAFSETAWYDNQPEGVIYIGRAAYKYKGEMPANSHISIKEGTSEIIESAFDGCIGLTSVTIPNSVICIGKRAFFNCGLTSVIIPDNVETIGDYAFRGLSSVVIGKNVKSIGVLAFGSYKEELTMLISMIENLFPIQNKYGDELNSVFSYRTFDHALLYVPVNAINKYRSTNGWNEFKNIRELAIGDVNIDFEVNQADLDATTDFIMDKYPKGFYESLADLNGDDKVDAADVVKLVTILNIQDGLNMDCETNYSNQVISSLSCTLNNDGDKAIQLTKCELYFKEKLVKSSKFKVTLSTGGSKKCSFDDLATYSADTGFSVVWYYTYNGEDYTYRCDLSE